MVILRVDLDELRPSFTCGICFNIIDQVTRLSECLHNFCWKCIYGKITEHAWKCCPVCYADLGDRPLRTPKHDPKLEMLRQFFFPSAQEDVIYVESDSESSGSSHSLSSSYGDNSAC